MCKITFTLRQSFGIAVPVYLLLNYLLLLEEHPATTAETTETIDTGAEAIDDKKAEEEPKIEEKTDEKPADAEKVETDGQVEPETTEATKDQKDASEVTEKVAETETDEAPKAD